MKTTTLTTIIMLLLLLLLLLEYRVIKRSERLHPWSLLISCVFLVHDKLWAYENDGDQKLSHTKVVANLSNL